MIAAEAEPHAVLFPVPAQGHITPFLRLATLVLARRFHVTFVLTEYNARRLARSRGHDWAAAAGPSFRVETIPDGLPPPPSDKQDVTQDVPATALSMRSTCLGPFRIRHLRFPPWHAQTSQGRGDNFIWTVRQRWQLNWAWHALGYAQYFPSTYGLIPTFKKKRLGYLELINSN
ncbi:hypothetical protein ZIOFF_003121 [Zingiber officinale]|uniref:Uncharacterized protein n=1 Tax=Zingiber officinale TaxID=94328 RepID=A0A8J5I8V2_ZINOF|nr:hypothetical protein ZIOFF_003121 [Zingiber officinale]